MVVGDGDMYVFQNLMRSGSGLLSFMNSGSGICASCASEVRILVCFLVPLWSMDLGCWIVHCKMELNFR